MFYTMRRDNNSKGDNERKLFKATIHMDYKNPEHDTIEVTRSAPSLLEAKKDLQDRLNPSNITVVSLVDNDGAVRMVHTMKVGDIKLEEVEE